MSKVCMYHALMVGADRGDTGSTSVASEPLRVSSSSPSSSARAATRLSEERCGLAQRGGDEALVGVMYPVCCPTSEVASDVGPTLTMLAAASDGESPCTLTLTERGAREPSDASDPLRWCSVQFALGWRLDARLPAPLAHPGPMTGPGGGGSGEDRLSRMFLRFGSVCRRSSMRMSASYMSFCQLATHLDSSPAGCPCSAGTRRTRSGSARRRGHTVGTNAALASRSRHRAHGSCSPRT